MEYIVNWVYSGNQRTIDHWEMFDTMKEAKKKVDKLLRNEKCGSVIISQVVHSYEDVLT